MLARLEHPFERLSFPGAQAYLDREIARRSTPAPPMKGKSKK
jgi:hypothetical protein